MKSYDVKRMVSKLGIVVIVLFGLMTGSVMISQATAGARHVRTSRRTRRTRIQHRRTKGVHVKRAKRLHKLNRRSPKRRTRKMMGRIKPRKMKIERRGTDDPVSIEPKRK